MSLEDPRISNRQRPSVGEFTISSLTENTRAHLYARTWDGVGYWRWEKGRRRNYKSFFRFNRFNVPIKVPEFDWPEGWTPITPIPTNSSAPIHRPTIPNVPDVSAGLEIFADRLMMALKVHLAMPDEIRAMTRIRVYGLTTCSGPGDYAPGIDTRFRPTLAQREDSERILTWFAKLEKEQQELCWLRAKGFSIRAIAEMPKFKKGKSDATGKVRTLYNRAVIDCYRFSQSESRNFKRA